LLTVFYLFWLIILVQLSYWIFFVWEFNIIKGKKTSEKVDSESISLVVCLKNEEHNLTENFTSWTTQIDGESELILVDDFSTDDTYAVASRLCLEFNLGQCIKSSFDRPGKKQALTDGVQTATKDFILITDADCNPSDQWKQAMAKYLLPKTDFVLGFAPFYQKAGFLNLFQRFECVLTALQYFSYAQAGLPYMGVGRNMLFRKAIFDAKIYEDQIASGDDDLLVSALANKKNTELCMNKEAFVYSEAPATTKKYWHQKLRHISSSTKYSPKVKILLSLFSSTQILTYIILPLILTTPYWQEALILLLIKLLTMAFTLRKTGKLLAEEDLFKMTPFLDLSLTIYYLILALSYPFKKKTTWN